MKMGQASYLRVEDNFKKSTGLNLLSRGYLGNFIISILHQILLG